ncbi:fluoride efflux transporter CrcB [Streptomyces sp. NPDC127068]|uniref:fluoride efflux transporter CrcB n=1 Tax=Streptomyces sp. NPDC127068 TaxID=3347127 RepID=UPI003663AF06
MIAPPAREPVDPDVAPADRAAPVRRVLAAVACGGALGAGARYGAVLLRPTPAGAFPWTTLTVNAVGCALIGVLMAALTAARTPGPLVRPFLGTGVLGGFTTFSAYAVDVQQLVRQGEGTRAAGYLLLTPLCALAAVWAGARLTRWALRRGRS